MNAKIQERTASGAIILAGLWVAFSPSLLDMSQSAGWNAMVAGGLLALMGALQLVVRPAIPSVIAIGLSLWFVVTAFIFEQSAAAMWSLVIAGAVGVVAAAWDTIAALDVDAHNTMHPVT